MNDSKIEADKVKLLGSDVKEADSLAGDALQKSIALEAAFNYLVQDVLDANQRLGTDSTDEQQPLSPLVDD